jgi:hypothetical protein
MGVRLYQRNSSQTFRLLRRIYWLAAAKRATWLEPTSISSHWQTRAGAKFPGGLPEWLKPAYSLQSVSSHCLETSLDKGYLSQNLGN